MDIQELRKLLASAIGKMEGIAALAKEENRGLSSEELAKFEQAEAEVENLKASIKAAEKLADLKAEANRGTRQPVDLQVLRNEGEDEKGDCKVWGSFGEQMQAVIQVEKNPRSPRSRELNQKLELTNQIMSAASGMNEAVGADGGVLVQKDFANDIVDKAYLEAPFASQVQRLTLSSNSNGIKIPYVDETSRVDGSRQGGIQMYWESEGADITATKGKFGLMELNLKKIVGAAYLTEELIADASVLGSWVTGAFQRELAFKLDDAFINGDGSGKPLGILNGGAIVEQAKETSQTAATVNANNLAKMYSRLFKRNRGSAIWLYNQAVEAQLMTLSLTVGSNSYPVFLLGGTTGNMRGEVPVDTILGRSAYASEHCAALGTAGDVIFTDPKAYIAIDKGGPKSAVSVHVRFLQDEQVLKFTYRVDGQPSWRAALTPFKGNTTLSPYVSLAVRS